MRSSGWKPKKNKEVGAAIRRALLIANAKNTTPGRLQKGGTEHLKGACKERHSWTGENLWGMGRERLALNGKMGKKEREVSLNSLCGGWRDSMRLRKNGRREFIGCGSFN